MGMAPTTICALAALTFAGAASAQVQAVQRVGLASPWVELNSARVRLLAGPFRDAQDRNGKYLLSLQPDRMLHNFRATAGLPPKAPAYLGWESEEPWVGIRCQGHTLGHYLSAVSMMFASTGNQQFAERAAYIVSELRVCQRARGDGLVCAFPDGPKPSGLRFCINSASLKKEQT